MSDHVFSVSASALINAPPDKVWSILMDFPSYPEWNPFVRSLVLTSRDMVPLSDQTAEEGKHVQIVINMAPSLSEPRYLDRGSAAVVISTLDPKNYRIAWKADMLPAFLLSAERWQTLTIDETTGQTKYESFEAFSGVLSYVTKFLVAAKIAKGFEAAANGLKKRAEET